MTNAYLLGEGNDSVLIDAPEGVTDWLEQEGEMPKELLLTHQHYDHVQDAAKLVAKGDIKIRAYADYSQDLTLETYGSRSGIPISVQPYTVHEVLEKTETLVAGAYTFRIKYIPGHSTDSIAFITQAANDSTEDTAIYVFAGDTLFAGGIGRPDLPGGDLQLLLDGINSKLLTLPDHAHVFSGHGAETSIGHERLNNPYLQ